MALDLESALSLARGMDDVLGTHRARFVLLKQGPPDSVTNNVDRGARCTNRPRGLRRGTIESKQ